jgi:hypothetical protein
MEDELELELEMELEWDMDLELVLEWKTESWKLKAGRRRPEEFGSEGT